LSFALAWAEVLGSTDIFTGVNAVDYSGYPDCRPEYIEAFEKMANLATKAGVEGNKLKIHTPLIDLAKAATQPLEIRIIKSDESATIICREISVNIVSY
jgi:7-cyano-7-deazaguanine synthase